jgi:pyruvate dehydrogenase E2 component (dihydrolipoamide acetyltransferase)
LSTLTASQSAPLAFDHRVNDGADAARFMRTLIDTLHDPESFLLRI